MEKKEYKNTLQMPNTGFDMKANLLEKEPFYYSLWEKNKIYQKALKNNHQKPSFVLHDGPPYANGSLHIGHALNKILKDIIVRYKTLDGFYTPYIPGWDTHGLPIENKMLELLKSSKDDLSIINLRKQAAQYALEQVEIQKNQFKKMNLFTDFVDYYITLDKKFEADQLRLFKKMYFDGLVYKGLKPVFWSPSSQSALAEAEVEYFDISSPQILVAFPTKEQDLFLVIMTTTPWTLLANAAVAVGKDIEYSYLKVNNKTYIVASKLVSEVVSATKWEKFEIIKKVYGQELLGINYISPLTKEVCKVVVGHHVSDDTGSGLVHIAPLFGEDDFVIGRANGISEIMHVNDDGTFNEYGLQFQSQFYLDANKNIGMCLEQQGLLLSLKFAKHSYPHDWRTNKPVIFRGTPQWFVSIDKIKPQILSELQRVKSYPEWGVNRLTKMIEDRQDWTISRQRAWGVPIIVFYDQDGQEVRNEAIFDHVISLIEQHGSDVWFEKTTDELLPIEFRNQKWTREMDIMDVWFDSGSSSIAIEKYLKVPCDLYLEGSDQYRGWFNSSLINSVSYRGIAPFKEIISHGFVLDGKGQKMSKSKGNTIDPLDVIANNGAEILRLWVANCDYTSDVSISNEILDQVAEMYRNIRNKIRFLLGNIAEFNVQDKIYASSGMDAYITEKIGNLKADVRECYSQYRFANALKTMNNFITEVSASYFDYTKDTLYADEVHCSKRLQVLTNMYDIAEFFILALSPILVVTCEEAYSFLPKANKKESVHLETNDWLSSSNQNQHAKEMESFFILKEHIYRQIEDMKKNGVIKRSQEVHFIFSESKFVELCQQQNINANLDILKFDLAELLQLGKVTVSQVGDIFAVQEWESSKCQRCWKHFSLAELNSDSLCSRCCQVLASK